MPPGVRTLEGDGGARQASSLQVGVWLVIAAVAVLFAAFTSTYVSRRTGADWQTGPLPPILWLNTAVLVTSSGVLEWARRAGGQGRTGVMRPALGLATLLGAGFVAGQIAAWRQLVASGILIASNPHAGFFYLLTGTHAVHLAGGIGVLLFALWKVRRPSDAATVLGPVSVYWHFVDLLWLYLFAILFWV